MRAKSDANSSDFTAVMLLADSLGRSEGKWSSRFNQAAMLATAGYSSYKLLHGVKEKWFKRATYEVIVPGNNDLYDSMIEWLYFNTSINEKESIQATSGRSSRLEGRQSPEDEESRIRLQYSGDRDQQFSWKNHTYSVRVDKLGTGKDLFFSEYNQMYFVCQTAAAREDLLELFEVVELERKKNPPRLYVPRWGSWTPVDRKVIRRLDSVVLDEGVKEHVVADLGEFLRSEETYATLGLPFHRGYLFHGGSGTGKSSLAQALAAEYGLDVYYLPLADLNAELGESLLRLVSTIPTGSVLLLEDIDSLIATHDRKEVEGQSEGPSLAAVLNTLDGALTPHGLVSIATTNCIEVLDEALIRSGRFDVNVKIDNVTHGQVQKLFSMAYPGSHFKLSEPRPDVSPADVVNLFKTNFADPRRAREEYESRFSQRDRDPDDS